MSNRMSVSWSTDRGAIAAGTGSTTSGPSGDESKYTKHKLGKSRTSVLQIQKAKVPSKESTDSGTGGAPHDSANRLRLRHMMSASDKLTKLPNSLVEMCVVVGMDEDTGLNPRRKSQCDSGDGVEEIFGQPMEASVLAVISSQLAYFPQSRVQDIGELVFIDYWDAIVNGKNEENHVNVFAKGLNVIDQTVYIPIGKQVDPFYPPIAAITTPMSPTGFTPHSMRGVYAPHPPSRSLSRRMSVKPRALPFPHNQEMINSLPPLCFPSDAYVHKTRPDESFHSLVLTSISGRRSYATCLVMYRQLSVKETPGGRLGLRDCLSSVVQHGDQNEDRSLCWVPTCICLITQQPYFTLLKECLSILIPKLRDKPNNLKHDLKEFTLQLTMVPIPPPGPVSIDFLLGGELMTVHPPDHPDKPVVDIPLHLPFLLFTLDQILQIVVCILTQQRLVFLSHDFAVITPIIECFLTYILPFKWPFVYVPVVWSSMLDLLEAPGCYIMGCSAAHRLRIAQIEGLVMVDLERAQVQICDTVRVASIPSRAAEEFIRKFQMIRPGFYDICMLSCPVASSYEEEKNRREKMQRGFQWEIQDCFLQMLVALFSDTNDYMNTELRVFKQEEFLASRLEEERDFYKQVLTTSLFKQFKEDRLVQKKDYYTQMEKKTKRLSLFGSGATGEVSRIRKSSSITGSTQTEAPLMKRKSSSNDYKFHANSQKMTNFMLPPFRLPLPTPQQFYEECIEQLGFIMQSVKTPSMKASYLYLRGMVKIGCGKPLEGLDEFHSLHTSDLSIFPFSAVEQVIDELSIEDKEHLHKQDFYKKAEILRKISQRKKRPHLPRTPVLHPEDLPQEGMIELGEFIKHMQFMEIAIDLDVIERLFNALSVGQGYLDTETFYYFHDCWKEAEEEAKEILPNIYDQLLDCTESVLKLSSLIRSDYGTGRLVLTDTRLFFMTEGSKEYQDVIKLQHIEKLEKFDCIYLVLQRAPALKITSTEEGAPPFVANLKAERNCWYTLITEMWAGIKIADAQKDPQIVQQAAKNVLLLDSVIRSAENNGATHAKHLNEAAWQLCHFTRLKDEGMANVTPETSSILMHKFNPSSNEAQKTTVEAMIYTPGKKGTDDDNHPRLWCAMGSGRVKVFNGINYMLEAEIDDAKDRVCCLQLVRGEQVWAGSFDTTIYIIDVVSYAANKQLVEHDDIVSDITTDNDSSTAYTASLNGQVIAWDTQTLVRKHSINLTDTDKLVSIKYYKDNIWCCTKDDIRVVNQRGEELRRLQHIDSHGIPQLIECFLITDVLWTGCGRQGVLACWDINTFEKKHEKKVACRGISRLVEVNNKIWAGSKQGKIYLFDRKTCKCEKQLSAHDDAVRALCKAENNYIITGAGSRDGKVAVWRANVRM